MNAQDYKVLFNQSTALQLILDTNLNIVCATKAFLNNFQTNTEVITGKYVFNVFEFNSTEFGNEGNNTVLASFNKVIKNKITNTLPIIKYNIPNKNGDSFIPRYWKITHSTILDDDNNVKYIVHTAEDVIENETITTTLSQQRKELQKIEESEIFSKTVLNASPDCIKILDTEGRLQFMNENGVCLLEIDDFSQFRNKYWWDLWGDDNQSIIKEAVSKALKGEKVQFQAGDITPKGTAKWWDIVVMPMRIDELTNKTGSLICVSRDITNYKDATFKVKEVEHRYQQMIHSSPSLILILKGIDLIVKVANDAMLEVLGKEKNILEQPLLHVIPELIEQGFGDLLSKVYTTGLPQYGYEVPVYLIRNGKKELFHFTYVYQAQRNIKGEIEGVAVIAQEVTPQALLNKKIKNSEEQFRLLVQQAPVAICVLRGQEYIIETINSQMLEMWDRSLEQAIKKPVFDVLPEFKTQGLKELLDNVIITGERFVAEELALSIRRNGIIDNIYVNFVYEPLLDVNGSITGVMALAHEITELVIARKKMEVQTRLFEDMLMTAPGFVCTLNGPNHVHDLVNEQYQTLFGKRQIKGKPIMEALPELKGQGLDKLLDKVYTTGEPYIGIDIPITLVRDENLLPELGYFNFSYQPMYNEQKEIYAILLFGYEVTAQMLAKKRIEESEIHFRQLADLMPSKISHTDIIGNAHYLNKHWFDYTGLSFDKLKDTGYHNIVHPDDLAAFTKNLKTATETKKVLEMEMRLLNKNGDYKWHLNLASPVLDENESIKMWVGSTTEIHEQMVQKEALELAVKERTAALEIANKELIFQNNEKEKRSAELNIANIELLFQNEEKGKRSAELSIANKELEAFNYVSSHDLQEPLRKIQTFAALILEKEHNNLSENGKYIFKRMQIAAGRMQQLIQDLLSFSRLNTADRRFERFDLNQIVNEVLQDFKDRIDEKNAVIEVASLAELNIVPFQFRQLMQNLLSNALKFAKNDTQLHISISTHIVKGGEHLNNKLIAETIYCHIVFEDNGIGFDQTFSDRIFDVFQKLHSRDEYAGTGIGLAIVKKIVENHNGVVSAHGELGKGTRFDIYIPTNLKNK